jgi:hypothetical protein
MQVRASVKVTNPDNLRAEQAGVIVAEGESSEAVVVRFDLDLELEVVATADLVQLCQN